MKTTIQTTNEDFIKKVDERVIEQANQIIDIYIPGQKARETEPRQAVIYDNEFWIHCETAHSYNSYCFKLDFISSCFMPFPHLINTDGDFKE